MYLQLLLHVTWKRKGPKGDLTKIPSEFFVIVLGTLSLVAWYGVYKTEKALRMRVPMIPEGKKDSS